MLGIDDSVLPNLRHTKEEDKIYSKYAWMLHAEANAILSCAKQGKSCNNSTLYIAGLPCLDCAQFAYQAGVTEIVHGPYIAKMMENEEYMVNWEIFKFLTKDTLTVRQVSV